MLARLEQALSVFSRTQITLNIVVGAPTSETPAQQVEREQAAFKIQTQQAITNDPMVQDIQQRFGASIVIDNIEPVAR